MSQNHLRLLLNVPFPTRREANIAFDVLRVDAEPKRGGVEKTLEIKEDRIVVSFIAPDARHMRVSVNSFLDHLMLVTEILETFGPPTSNEYSHY